MKKLAVLFLSAVLLFGFVGSFAGMQQIKHRNERILQPPQPTRYVRPQPTLVGNTPVPNIFVYEQPTASDINILLNW